MEVEGRTSCIDSTIPLRRQTLAYCILLYRSWILPILLAHEFNSIDHTGSTPPCHGRDAHVIPSQQHCCSSSSSSSNNYTNQSSLAGPIVLNLIGCQDDKDSSVVLLSSGSRSLLLWPISPHEAPPPQVGSPPHSWLRHLQRDGLLPSSSRHHGRNDTVSFRRIPSILVQMFS